MWPDLELFGVYPSRFSGVYFTVKGVFPLLYKAWVRKRKVNIHTIRQSKQSHQHEPAFCDAKPPIMFTAAAGGETDGRPWPLSSADYPAYRNTGYNDTVKSV